MLLSYFKSHKSFVTIGHLYHNYDSTIAFKGDIEEQHDNNTKMQDKSEPLVHRNEENK